MEWTTYSKQDYDMLEGSRKVFVDRALVRIQQRGVEAEASTRGNLAGCNELVHRKMGLRVIFREVTGKVKVIQMVIIGKRDDLDAYRISGKRIDSE